MKLIWILGGGIFTLFGFFFLFGYICFIRACKRRRSYPADRSDRVVGGGVIPPAGEAARLAAKEWWGKQSFETISVRSADGLLLSGKLLSAEGQNKGVILVFHGYHSCCERDLNVQIHRLHEAGYHLIMPCQRAHGDSEGKYICFGVKEREDVGRWCCLAAARFPDLPVVLFGLSMGAATVLYASETALPVPISCVIADCGYTNPWEILCNTLRHRHKIFPIPVIYFMNAWSRLLAKFDYREVEGLTPELTHRPPTLLIHGTEDRFVPLDMSYRNLERLGECGELLTVEGARHAQSVYFDTERYIKTVLDFLDRNRNG